MKLLFKNKLTQSLLKKFEFQFVYLNIMFKKMFISPSNLLALKFVALCCIGKPYYQLSTVEGYGTFECDNRLLIGLHKAKNNFSTCFMDFH